MKRLLTELAPSEQAKALGLVYLGFGGYGKPNDRIVIARTINGKLVRVGEEEEQEQDESLGRLIVIDFDDELLYTDLKKASNDVSSYIYLIKSLVKTGVDTIIMHSRNSEKKVAVFLRDIGISAGPTLVPFGSAGPDKKHDLVEGKIKEGYDEIYFFDRDELAVHAVESLKAQYNKLEIKIETHKIPKLKYDPTTRHAPDSKGTISPVREVPKGEGDKRAAKASTN